SARCFPHSLPTLPPLGPNLPESRKFFHEPLDSICTYVYIDRMNTITQFHGSRSDSFAEAPAPSIDWIWQGYLARGATTLLTSQWKAGKTTLVSVLLARLARGG